MTRSSFLVEVDCYAGYRGEETPRRFTIGGRRVEVVEILDRWLDPDHHYFKLLGDDGDLYILRHDAETDRWEMILYRSGPERPGAAPDEDSSGR